MADMSLSIRDLQGWYADAHVLHGIDMSVDAGECVSVLGRNGAGKTTTLRSIMGLIDRRKGSIQVGETETIEMVPETIARLGIGYVPEERGIYARLDVLENLLLPARVRAGGMSTEEIFALFPNLLERKRSVGTKLSGGEQQMLAIARVMRTGAQMYLLDEPTEGLAPVIVQHIGRAIQLLKARGCTVIIVEQNLNFALTIADRHIVIEEGRTVDMLRPEDLRADGGRLKSYLGL